MVLLDKSGKVVVKYVYDAWGNHEVCNPDGTVNDSVPQIGKLNPFRYRGYYYDTETGLYYLKYYKQKIFACMSYTHFLSFRKSGS